MTDGRLALIKSQFKQFKKWDNGPWKTCQFTDFGAKNFILSRDEKSYPRIRIESNLDYYENEFICDVFNEYLQELIKEIENARSKSGH